MHAFEVQNIFNILITAVFICQNLFQSISCQKNSNDYSREINRKKWLEFTQIFEGDIIISAFGRNFLTVVPIWDDGIVYYDFDRYAGDYFIYAVEYAMDTIELQTDKCIKFKPRTNQTDYVLIISKTDVCFAHIGRQGGLQQLHLGPDCGRQGTILHELYHALGFVHEQSRIDRDDYVTIEMENIRPDRIQEFDIINETDALGVPYDYRSIVHYDQFLFSINGKPTITTKDRRYQDKIGTYQTLSYSDIRKVKIKYGCK